MSDLDKAIAALIESGKANVTIIHAVAGGPPVNVYNGCVHIGSSQSAQGKAQPKKSNTTSDQEVEDDHTSAADEGVGGGDQTETPAATERNDRGASEQEQTENLDELRLEAAKGKILRLADELTNHVANNVDVLSSLSQGSLDQLLGIDDFDAEGLDNLLDTLFPDLAY